jgi:hypothetical protein
MNCEARAAAMTIADVDLTAVRFDDLASNG